MATNGPWYLELYFAACETGPVDIPVNLRFTLSELQRYLSRVDQRPLRRWGSPGRSRS